MTDLLNDKTEFLTKKGRKTHQAIIDAAMSLIKTKDFSATTVQDICSAAGVGVGTFYHYFQSKEEVLLAFLGEENVELNGFYEATDKTSYGKAILDVMNFYLDLYFRKGAGLVAQIYATVFFSKGMQVSSLIQHSFHEILRDALSRGQQSGEFTGQIPVETLCYTFDGAWFFLTSLWSNAPEEYDIRGMVNEHFSKLIELISVRSTA